MVSTAAQASHARAIQRDGVPIVFSRVTGYSPAVTTTDVSLTAIVRMAQPDTTSPAQTGISASAVGAIDQNQRFVILMASDLCAGGISLPIVRGDRIAVPSTGEVLNVERIDPYKRAYAGAIEIFASAVA